MKKKYWFGCWHCSQFLVVHPKGHFFQHSWMHVSAWTLALPMSLLPLSPWLYLVLEFTDSLHSNRGLLDEEPGKDTTSMDLHTLQRKAGTTNDCHKHIYLVQKQNHSTVKPKAVCTWLKEWGSLGQDWTNRLYLRPLKADVCPRTGFSCAISRLPASL